MVLALGSTEVAALKKRPVHNVNAGTKVRSRHRQSPTIKEPRVSFVVGHSVLEQFVLSHSPSDVLRELVQNEYDAGGTKLEVRFRTDGVTIRGNGKPIDSAGWNRLSVMLGSGNVTGSDRVVQRKSNGIGSKNFGLRSLFLLGDRIEIRSAGKQTFLDLSVGAPEQAFAHPGSVGRRGVEITVAYREQRVGSLEPFSAAREEQALQSFERDLAATMIKLAQPGAAKSVEQLIVTSERCGRQISWKQAVKKVPCRSKGVTAVERRILMRARAVNGQQGGKVRALEEIEFQKPLPVPESYQDAEIPGYFRLPAGRIRLSVSLRIRQGRVVTEEPGRFYYPLGALNDSTGTAISINAPFQMNPDRSQIQDPGVNPFNRWLLDQAVALTMDLLVSDWYERFGAEVYLALRQLVAPRVTTYLEGLSERLRDEECWPSRAFTRKQTVFRPASRLAVAEIEELLGSFLTDSQYLPDAFVKNRTLFEFAKLHGVDVFTVDSLVRLRCFPADRKGMATALEQGEADYSYTEFPKPLLGKALQERFGRAFDAGAGRLSTNNRKDLQRSATTLAADGSLASPQTLWWMTPSLTGVTPIPAAQQLDPALASFKVLRELCRPFKASEWIRAVLSKLPVGMASTEERVALYRYILDKDARFDAQTLAQIRKAPILLDHRGQWVAPERITLRRIPGAELLGPILHFPHADYEANRRFAMALQFRKRIDGSDIVAFAQRVQDQPDLAEGFEAFLSRCVHQLTERTIADLAAVPFLRTSLERLGKPRDVYLKNQLTQACLDDQVPFVAGHRTKLYERLGCLNRPRGSDIVAGLARLREQGLPPERPEFVYPALVQALKAEGIPNYFYQPQPLIWVGDGYASPLEVVAGTKYRSTTFLKAVPHVTGSSSLRQAVVALGASYLPQTRHWRRSLEWVSERYGVPGIPLPPIVQFDIRRVFAEMEAIPEGITDEIRFLPDRSGQLFSLADVRSHAYLIDDDPRIADLVMKAGNVPVAFADAGVDTLRFYSMVGVSSLSQILRRTAVEPGLDGLPPSWLKPRELMAKVHAEVFSSAVAALAAYEFRTHREHRTLTGDQLRRELRARTRLMFVRELKVQYQIAGAALQADEHLVLQADQILCCKIRSLQELYDHLSQAITTLVVRDRSAQLKLVDSISRLLHCADAQEMRRYLTWRGVRWSPSVTQEAPQGADQDHEDDETGTKEQVSEVVQKLFAQLSVSKHPAGALNTLTRVPTPHHTTPAKEDAPDTLPALPPIETVTPTYETPVGHAPQKQNGRSGRGGGRRVWSPPSQRQQEWDRMIGRRGEEIVYRRERARVTQLGFDADEVVVWTSDTDPGADHDIRSVDENGEEVWIEVKATTGKDGRFRWSKREFDKALEHRQRYILARVYKTDTDRPTVIYFTDPIGLLMRNEVRLEIDSLYAEVEPLSSSRG